VNGERIKPSYLAPGTAIGAYTVVEKVADGGSSHVYKVTRGERVYALKLSADRLKDQVAGERKYAEERLDREVAALTSLRHPNIVRVHAFDRWPDPDDYPYIVMDLVEGEALCDWQAASAPSLERICIVFEKIASALDHMHHLGIIHRDFRSDHVLVRGDGEPILIDLGIARPRVSFDVTRHDRILGATANYAPEYVAHWHPDPPRSSSTFDWKPTSDLHSFGYALYQILTGQRPFPVSPEKEDETLHAITSFVPKAPSLSNPLVPKAMDEIVLKLLEKDPARRFQDAREVASRLAQARADAGASWRNPFDVPEGEEGAPSDELPVTSAMLDMGLEPERGATRIEEGGARDEPSDASESAQETDEPGAPRQGGAEVPEEKGDDGSAADPRKPTPQEESIAQFKARLEKSAPRRRPRVLIGGGIAVLATLLLVALLAPRSKREEQRNLRLPSEARPSSNLAIPPVALAPTPPDRPPPKEAHTPTEAKPARTVESTRGPRTDEALAAEGQRRARAAGRHAEDAPRDVAQSEEEAPLLRSAAPAEPQVIQWAQRAPGAPVADASAASLRGVPLGTHLRAKLLTSLDSRTIGSGPVEAVLATPTIVRDRVALPARTFAYGVASETNGRFMVRFTRLRLPDDSELVFSGIALAKEDGKPGLAASSRIEGGKGKADGAEVRIAKGTGTLLLDSLTAGVPGQAVAQAAGHAFLDQGPSSSPPSSQDLLLLDSGVAFEIWVEKTF